MVKDGVLVELPLYFSVFDSVLIVVMVPLLFFSHSTLVKGRLEDTLHNSDGTGESDMTTLMVSGTLFLVY
jgi:hypothetical protein